MRRRKPAKLKPATRVRRVVVVDNLHRRSTIDARAVVAAERLREMVERGGCAASGA